MTDLLATLPIMQKARAFSLAFLWVTTLAACSSSSSSNSGTTTGAGGSTGTTTGSGTTGAGAGGSTGGGGEKECPPGPGYGGGEAKLLIKTVEATIVDLAGNPVADTPAQACGTDICITGTTDAKGHVLIQVDKELTAAAIKFGDALLFAKLAIPITESSVVYPKLVTAKLPSAGVKLVAGGEVVSGEVTLNLPAGGTIIIDDLVYDDDDKQLFRAATIPIADAAPVLDVDPSLELELLFGVSPIETLMCPPAKVTVPNSAKWAAGTDVEFVIQGVDVGQEWAPYSKWQKISDGKVSADGATVSTVDGGGLPVLTVFGVRKKK